jgi:phage terminase large subunit-like protein
MSEQQLTPSSLARWRNDACGFIETVLYDPGEGVPFKLLPAERVFLEHALKRGDNGKLLYPELLYSCPKKSGKTTFAALVCLTIILLSSEAFPEATLAANDQEQAMGRVFEMCRRIVAASPLLKREAKITQDKITFPAFNAIISAIPASFAGAAGGNQNISIFDEAWAYTSERSRRLWDELVPPPTRKIACRLTVTYAGFEGESLLLEELYKRGLQQPSVGKDLYAGDGLLMFWSHEFIAPWQDEAWHAQQRRERPSAYQRQVLNEFAASSSQFVDMSAWDACVQPSLGVLPYSREHYIWVGVDASTKRDSTAICACTYDRKTNTVRLANHRIFTPTATSPINFEDTVERTLLEWHQHYRVRQIRFDPYQLVSVAQRLAKAGLPIEEYPQSIPNLTAAASNLFDLISQRQLALYPDSAMRLAVSRAIVGESSRGFKLDKAKQHHHIDVVVALSMACLAAVQEGGKPFYDLAGALGYRDEPPLAPRPYVPPGWTEEQYVKWKEGYRAQHPTAQFPY